MENSTDILEKLHPGEYLDAEDVARSLLCRFSFSLSMIYHLSFYGVIALLSWHSKLKRAAFDDQWLVGRKLLNAEDHATKATKHRDVVA